MDSPSNLQKIIKSFNDREQKFSEHEMFQQTFVDKGLEDIKKIIETELTGNQMMAKLMEDASDDGGIIAISGFYFQFLSTIEYIIELLEGKWEYILVDHHQDIMVVNEETIRMVQVKTKNKESCLVSETKIHSQWIPELIKTNKLFENLPINKQFELITNFYPVDSPNIKIEPFLHNEDHELKVESSFIDVVKKYSERSGYEPEEIEKYLKKLNINVKANENYLYRIRVMVGEMFGESLVATENDIYFIIGYISSHCYFPKNTLKQLIDREKAEKLKDELSFRIVSNTRNIIEKIDSLKFIDDYMEEKREEFEELGDSPKYLKILASFEDEIKAQQTEKHNLYSFLGKLVSRMSSSAKVNNASVNKINNWTKELLDIMLILRMKFDCRVEMDFENEKLLIKNVSNNIFNTFNLERTNNLDEGKRLFSDALNSNPFAQKEKLLRNGRINVIFTGKFNSLNQYKTNTLEEISIKNYSNLHSFEGVSVPGISREEEFTTVTLQVMFINGHTRNVTDLFENIRESEDLPNYIKYLDEKFKEVDIND